VLRFPKQSILVALIGLSACAAIPSGPSLMALPGSTKTFDEFRADDAMCRQYAYELVAGVTPEKAATDAGLASALVGTALGAAAGAAFGGGEGALIGAGAGLLLGSAVGTGYASGSWYVVQQRYDNGYVVCMYAKGHKVPVSGQFASYRRQTSGPSSSYYPPPPPPSAPPPPPPR